jgi:hypothetical protein
MLSLGWSICGLAVVVCASCSKTSPPNRERFLTDPLVARRAIEESLNAWRSSPLLERTTPNIRPVMFVDQSRKPGQRLREYAILGESAGLDGCRRFQVKLALEEPAETILAAYYVFGQGPVWVYRSEDFEMMMHMDPMIPEAPAEAGAAAPPPGGRLPAESKHHEEEPKKKASGEKAPVS